jgi:hypothetical protein
MMSVPQHLPHFSDKDIENLSKIISSHFERLQSYSKVVIGLAYAALLAIWTGARQTLSQKQLVGSALLIVISIVLYVAFEIGQMLLYQWMHWKWTQAARVKLPRPALQEYIALEGRIQPRLYLSWYITFILCVITGFGAACILIYAFCHRLLTGMK